MNLFSDIVLTVYWRDYLMQSVPITTDVSLNIDQGEVYNIMQ
jgi:hypothetical protein